MKNPEPIRECPECGEKITGRSDKKFCSDACRSSFNNRRHLRENPVIKIINRILLKNHSILRKLNPDDNKVIIDKERLSALGFSFDYYTHIFNNQKGGIYYFCYDQGYLNLAEDHKILLVRQKKK